MGTRDALPLQVLTVGSAGTSLPQSWGRSRDGAGTISPGDEDRGSARWGAAIRQGLGDCRWLREQRPSREAGEQQERRAGAREAATPGSAVSRAGRGSSHAAEGGVTLSRPGLSGARRRSRLRRMTKATPFLEPSGLLPVPLSQLINNLTFFKTWTHEVPTWVWRGFAITHAPCW